MKYTLNFVSAKFPVLLMLMQEKNNIVSLNPNILDETTKFFTHQ